MLGAERRKKDAVRPDMHLPVFERRKGAGAGAERVFFTSKKISSGKENALRHATPRYHN